LQGRIALPETATVVDLREIDQLHQDDREGATLQRRSLSLRAGGLMKWRWE